MPFWILPAALAAGQLIGNLFSQSRQNKKNRELAEFQADANEQYLNAQNQYNTPKAQMARFTDAGLNPHLIYGQGSPGNQSQSLSYPDIQKTDYQSAMAQLTPQFNQSLMTQSQVAATDAKTQQTYVVTQLNKIQAQVLQANPALNEAGFNAMIENLILSAKIKGTQLDQMGVDLMVSQASAGHQVNKIFQEVQLLEQRFKLSTLDAQIRAQVITSKEFQNALLDVQKKWMQDGEITPQHIYQFIQMLLMKMF